MGIYFKCEIKGIDKLEKRVDKIVKELPKKVKQRIEDMLEK